MRKQLKNLTHIRASIIIMQAHNSRFEEYFTNPGSLSDQDHIDILPPLDDTVTDFMRYSAYKQLLVYADHNAYCRDELVKLDKIIESNHKTVVKWVDRNDDFFLDQLFYADHDLSLDDNDDEALYQWTTKERLVKKDWLPVVVFSEVMRELSFGKYSDEMVESELEGNGPNNAALEIIGKIKGLIGTL